MLPVQEGVIALGLGSKEWVSLLLLRERFLGTWLAQGSASLTPDWNSRG